MTAAPVIAPRALRDLDAALSFMGEDDAQLDGAFRDGFDKAVRAIAEDDLAGGVMPELEQPELEQTELELRFVVVFSQAYIQQILHLFL
jgi:hypothetical protein